MSAFDDRFKSRYDTLVQTGVLGSSGRGFSMRRDDYMVYMGADETPFMANLHDIRMPEDWTAVHRELYLNTPNIRAIIQSQWPYTRTAAQAGDEVPPLLDDFAQLVGVSARVVEENPHTKGFGSKVIRGITRRNAVLIPEWGGLCVAGTFDDALAVAQVLEKNCQALVDTSFLGGGHRINRLESWLMRLVYRYKYSKMK